MALQKRVQETPFLSHEKRVYFSKEISDKLKAIGKRRGSDEQAVWIKVVDSLELLVNQAIKERETVIDEIITAGGTPSFV